MLARSVALRVGGVPLVVAAFVAVASSCSSGHDPSSSSTGAGGESSGTGGSSGPGTATSSSTTTASSGAGGADPNDPFGPEPATNTWPPGPSSQMTPGGVPFDVNMPAGDTTGSILVVGGFTVGAIGPADGAITLAIQGNGTLGPKACLGGGGMSGVPHVLFPSNVHEVLLFAAKNVRFDHKRAFVEGGYGASGNNAGWGVIAAMDASNQPLVAGVYVGWAEYNNAPCTAVSLPAGPGSPKALFVSANQCDQTYCPLKSCIQHVQQLGYAVTFNDPLSPATCDCNGPCDGAIVRPHFKGIGDQSVIKPWILATSK